MRMYENENREIKRFNLKEKEYSCAQCGKAFTSLARNAKFCEKCRTPYLKLKRRTVIKFKYKIGKAFADPFDCQKCRGVQTVCLFHIPFLIEKVIKETQVKPKYCPVHETSFITDKCVYCEKV